MTRISNIADLKKYQDAYKARREAESRDKVVVNVSLATCGIASGGIAVMEAMQDEVSRQGLQNVEFRQSGCMTYCHSEPTVEVTLPGHDPLVFGKLDETAARLLVEKYIKSGEPTGTIIPVNYNRVTL
jgi:NADP-reducing hydrogenase subunit HndB